MLQKSGSDQCQFCQKRIVGEMSLYLYLSMSFELCEECYQNHEIHLQKMKNVDYPAPDESIKIPPPPLPEIIESVIIQKDPKCSGCHKLAIKGDLYFCKPCSFDVCRPCFLKGVGLDHPHPLSTTFKLPTSATVIHANTRCDCCGWNPIKGTRHFCPKCNFDLCQYCIEEGAQHNHNLIQVDSFVLIKNREASTDFRYRIHKTSKCDSCLMLPIIGTRFNCKECNFDLCKSCLRKGVTHPHKLIPINSFMEFS